MDPYIGITDFSNRSQVWDLLEKWFIKTHKLHVGVMSSYKYINNLSDKYNKVWVPTDRYKSIFVDDERVYNCIHYADFSHKKDLFNNICYLIRQGGQNLHAIQLDMCWPCPEEITKIKKVYPGIDIILQIGHEAFDLLEINVISKLFEYKNVIDGVLLDLSGGRGKKLNAEFLLPYIEFIKKYYPNINVAVAGGLGPHTLHLLDPLKDLFPNLSIDAQGRLRNSGKSTDPIDWSLAENYLISAQEFITGKRTFRYMSKIDHPNINAAGFAAKITKALIKSIREESMGDDLLERESLTIMIERFVEEISDEIDVIVDSRS